MAAVSRGGHAVVEDHQPNAPLPVEQRPGNGAEGEPGEDPEEDGEAGHAGRSVSLKDEQDQGDLPHLRREPAQHRPERQPPKPGDTQQRAV